MEGVVTAPIITATILGGPVVVVGLIFTAEHGTIITIMQSQLFYTVRVIHYAALAQRRGQTPAASPAGQIMEKPTDGFNGDQLLPLSIPVILSVPTIGKTGTVIYTPASTSLQLQPTLLNAPSAIRHAVFVQTTREGRTAQFV